MKTKTIAKVNNVAILCVDHNGRQLVPVNPVFTALGVTTGILGDDLKDAKARTFSVAIPVPIDFGIEKRTLCMPLEVAYEWARSIEHDDPALNQDPGFIAHREYCVDILLDHWMQYNKVVQDEINDMEAILEAENRRIEECLLQDIEEMHDDDSYLQ